ncbi:MAG: N-6 DNA methylase [Candidatus Roizmanbacteria bacterium GW2011_GWA2_35_19]|uniref:site-specific DNA-methyltransferase (adenine-specific) n=2 Tax=Candidatus Roizmaniibacteriota TaxID=1752723 RepID=A0A0G0F1L4_9BACT|nr:MAG: N-6 DNA methylase [Candidatus Roizmanbacteria bacterium GW2011_GWC2_35_12]KKP73302.1 MAG: N-6 DNA methylase [Candidatus Roizmanbacteria bacterium GW2011_GWA2_35_19]
MPMQTNTNIVNKLWGYCHVLRHDGMDYGDYVEQLTYLLFLKMAEEKGAAIPKEYSWDVLKTKAGTDLTDFYSDLLRGLAKQDGLLGDIFTEALSKFTKPVNLKRLIDLIDEIDWSGLNIDVKAQAYEGLLEKSAAEGKKGAGQYFTPRVLIQAIVSVMKPDPRAIKDFTICDPAAGTGGFLLSAYEWLMQQTEGAINREDIKRIKENTYFGTELVARPRRLALMNLYLHGIIANIRLGDSLYEPDRGDRYDVILTNPPFGTKGANQVPERQDFTVATSNKQLNFVQHILTILKPGGRAAVVLPDNVLFGDQAGEVFKILMQDCNLHTILRLPNGTFTPYSQGVKANVVFFTKGMPTENVWIYDARTNVPGITKNDRPLLNKHFDEFEKCYGDSPNGQSPRSESQSRENRWKKFTIAQVKEKNYKLDSFKWIKDEAVENGDGVGEPEELIADALTELKEATSSLEKIYADLKR